MRDRLRLFAIRRPATAAAVASFLIAIVAASILIVTCGYSTDAIFASTLVGVVVGVLSAAMFGALLREHIAGIESAASRISDLANSFGLRDQSDTAPVAHLQSLDRDITAFARTFRSLQREREQSQSALDLQIARQAEFYAHLSHELRSPLNAILGYASLAIEDAEGGHATDLQGDLRKIRGAGQSLLALIDNLLQLAEDKTGRESVARAPFNLRELLTRVIDEHREVAPDVRFLLAEVGNETLFGNRSKVARALSSVIDDAIRSRHAREITISTRAESAGSASIEILFGVLSNPAMSINEGGALTRHLADRLAGAVAGTLVCEGGGAGLWSYVLRVPFDIDAPQGPAALSSVELQEVAKNVHTKGAKSALVIDDDPATIDLMGRWLERIGYSVWSAANADQGLEVAQAMVPDIILLDALMPGRTGYDILPVLSAMPTLRDTPILLVTVDDDRARGLAAGASDYIRKPVTEGRLREIVSVYESDLQGEILIIEDERDAAELMERTVRRLGFSTRHASDGAEGLAALHERMPSAILLDLKMPKLDGFAFIEELARSARFMSIPLIVLSGQELSVAQHHRLVAAGCRYYMKGSTAPREIAESLREMVA